jgi:ribosomal-protein-alanine N-acetyltransferase
MISIDFQVRRAVGQDYDRLANLIYHEANSHRHLDWHSPLEWLGDPNYWVCEEGGKIVATLACPQDPPHVAWIRFFGCLQYIPPSQVWQPLWNAARQEMIHAHDQAYVAAIITKDWFQSILLSSGFELKQNIVLLEWRHGNDLFFQASAEIRVRPMEDADLPVVTQIDLAAFGQFWHNTEDTLRRARAQCASATVAEDASGVIGYQISTKSPIGVHLARLAVKPEAQGRDVGTALVSQLIRQFNADGSARLSVNTQADNNASLSLYRKMGFVRTGEQFPVLVYPIAP